MGHAYTYRCSHCGYQEQFNHGHGFLIHSQPVEKYLATKTKLFHYKTHDLIVKLAKEHNNIFIKAGFQIYICPKCKILKDKTEVVVFNESEEIHRSEFRCAICKSRLKLTNIHRLKNAICPKCQNKTFQADVSNSELWV